MAGNRADKIIFQTAAKILVPEGIFERGKSRVWIDDNGWVLTVIDFSRGTWGKGSHLHVGLHFLWNDTDDLSIDFGGKEVSHASYIGEDESFAEQMEEQAKLAMEQVRYYRTFSDTSLAEKRILGENTSAPLGAWNKMMICLLNGSAPRGRTYLKEVIAITTDNYQPWAIDLHRKATREIALIMSNQEKCMQYILGLIRANRCALRDKSNMARLKENKKFG